MFSKASFIRVLNGGVVHQWMWMFPKTAASGTRCNFAAFEPYAWIKKEVRLILNSEIYTVGLSQPADMYVLLSVVP